MHGEHVIGVPVHLIGQVRSLHRLLTCLAIVQQPDQCRLAVEVFRQVGKDVAVSSHAGDNFVSHLPNGPVVVRQEHGLHGNFLGGIVFRDDADQRQFLADIFLQELLRAQQIVLVILFEHIEFLGSSQGNDVNCCRIHLRGNIHVAQVDGAVGQAHAADVAHQGDVGIINGDGQFLLVLLGGGHRGLCAGYSGDAPPRQNDGHASVAVRIVVSS